MSKHHYYHHSSPNPECYIDDDIQHNIQKLFTARTQSTCTTPESGHSEQHHEDFDLEASLCCLVQQERNLWKDKLQASLQEIDRYHRESLALRMALQGMVAEVGLAPCNDCEDDYSNWGTTSDLIKCLKQFVNASKSSRDKPLPTIRDMKAEKEIAKLKATISSLHQEKIASQEIFLKQSKQIGWLNKEGNQMKLQLHKLRNIVRNYNESHSSKFHLDQVELHKTSPSLKTPRIDSLPRERTYTEGELVAYPSPSVESEVMKARLKQKIECKGISPSQKVSPRVMISQCLRCQKLFKHGENNAMACRFHKKGREIKEQYDETGKLIKVIYKWACCKKVLDMPGCTYGHHV